MTDDESKLLLVSTDQSDYAPGTTATFTATTESAGDTVTFTVNNVDTGVDGILGTADDQLASSLSGTGTSWSVTDGGEGDLDAETNNVVVTTWDVNQDAANQAFVLTAVSQASGEVATAAFTDSNPKADIDQWNDKSSSWQNGNLNVHQSDYAEGDSVGFRLVFDNLVEGTNYTITLKWDSLQGGSHAYDYLTSYNATESPDPLADTGVSGSPSTVGIPNDPNGPALQQAGVFSMWGATLTGTSTHTLETKNNGDQETSITLNFVGGSDGKAVLAWGGHLAVDADWGGVDDGDGAADITGAPFHMGLGQSIFGGAQDRSIQIGEDDNGGPDPTASISFDKVTVAGEGVNQVADDGLTLLAGSSISWAYTITNTGDTTLTNIVVTDDNGTPDIATDDWTTTIASLAAGATVTVSQTGGVAAVGDYLNAATVTADSVVGQVGGNDPSWYFGATAGGSLDKQLQTGTSSWLESGAGVPALGTEPVVLVGSTVNFRAVVHNSSTGGLSITGATVTDSVTNATPPSQDIAAGADATFDIGWVAALAGYHTNTASVTGTVSDAFGNSKEVNYDDTAAYFGATAGGSLDKQLLTGTSGWLESGAGVPALGTEPVVLVGSTINFKAVVHNSSTGGLSITGATVTDSVTNATPASQDIAAGADATFDIGTVQALAGYHTNTASVSGTVADSFGHSTTVNDSDTAAYYGAAAGIHVEKLVSVDNGVNWYFQQDVGDDSLATVAAKTGIAAANLHVITSPLTTIVGTQVKYEFVVTNTSDALLAAATNETLNDATLGLVNVGLGSLASGASTTYVVSPGASTVGLHTNTVSAKETVSDSFGNTANPGDSDSVAYTGLGMAKAGLSKGYWSNHTWDSRADGGLIVGDSNLSGSGGTTGGDSYDLKIDKTVALALINSSTTGDARIIMAGQAEAAQLNAYYAGATTKGLLDAAGEWFFKYGNQDDLTTSAVGTGLTPTGGTVAAAETTTSKSSGIALEGAVVSTTSTAWSGVNVNDLFKFTYNSAEDLGRSHTVAMTGEGLKNALMAYDHGIAGTTAGLVVSTNGSLVGWQDGVGNISHVYANSLGDTLMGYFGNANISGGAFLAVLNEVEHDTSLGVSLVGIHDIKDATHPYGYTTGGNIT